MTDEATTETGPDNTDTATADTPVPERPGNPPQGDDGQDSTDAGSDPNAEARKWRLQLRDTEKRLAAADQRITAMQRAEVERLCTTAKTRPDALWDSGIDLAALLADDGTVDPDAVKAAITSARDRYGIIDPPLKASPVSDPGNFSSGTTGRPTGTRTPDYLKAFQPEHLRNQ